VRYLNGGGAKNLPVKLRAQLEPHYRVEFADFKEYDFARVATTRTAARKASW
jgi:hypothetical protein